MRAQGLGRHTETVYGWVKEHAERTPDAVAILAPGIRASTYADLWTNIAKTALFLQRRFPPNAVIALALNGGPEQFALFLAVSGACTCAPLNPLLTAAEFEDRLRELAAHAVVVDAASRPNVEAVARSIGISMLEIQRAASGQAGAFDIEELLPAAADHAGPAPVSAPKPPGTVVLLRTSATTGPAKLVPLTHRNLSALARQQVVPLRLNETDRVLSFQHLFHMHGLTPLVSQLYAGGSMAIAGEFEPNRILEWMNELEPTWYTTNATVHQSIVASFLQANPRPRHRLRFVRTGAGPVSDTVLAQITDVLGIPALRSYGSTEAATMACESLDINDRKPGSSGRSTGPEIATFDEFGARLPLGSSGEIRVRGQSVTPGYWSRERGLESTFRDGWLATGDLGYVDQDGFVFVTGRAQDIINRGGQKVSPQEVDEAMAAHPAVQEAITFGVTHPTLGEDVACAVVPKPGASITGAELRAFLAEQLAASKIPRQVFFLERLPLGPTGKPLRAAAAQLCLASLDRDIPQETTALTPLQASLKSIWQRMLKAEVTLPTTDFFVLGGDSLSALVMLVECGKEFGLDLTGTAAAEFLATPTIAKLAELIETSESPFRGRKDIGQTVLALQVQGTRPPIFCVPARENEAFQFMGLSRHLGNQQPMYALRTSGTVEDRKPIEVHAHETIAAIRSVRPAGPYWLAGFSYGGSVAFAVAARLVASGEEVGFVALFDSAAPGYPKPLRQWKQYAKKALSMDAWRTMTLANTLDLLENLIHLSIRHVAAPVRRSLGKGRIPSAIEKMVADPNYELRHNLFRIPRLKVPVFQFLSADDPIRPEVLEDPRLSWRHYCDAGFTIRIVPGDHTTMLAEPHARELANAFEEAVKECAE